MTSDPRDMETAVPSAPVASDSAQATPELAPISVISSRRTPVRPFIWGFAGALGIVAAALLTLALINLATLLFSIFMAAFITVGLDPLVRTLERRGLKRGAAILIVILAIIAIVVAIIWIVVPVLLSQIISLASSIPGALAQLESNGWFDGANAASNGVIGAILTGVVTTLQDPAFWAFLAGGVTKFGLGITSAVSGALFILILTIYFIGTYVPTKNALYGLVSKSHRESFMSYSEQILENVGRYLSGMVILAFMNATYSTILLLIVGVPGALLIGVVAFFITIIPLIGTVLTTIAMSIIAFIYSPPAGLIVLVFMLIYMQVEAYVLTPRIMSKAVEVPGSVVLISAIAGGTLFGLLGALVAIPTSAGIILIIRGVVMPRQELR